MKNVNLSEKEYARFEARVQKDKCWEWLGPLDKDGYGTFYLRRKPRRAHRVSWYAHQGMIKEGYVIHHVCMNRRCVNPGHLEMVTRAVNNMRSNSISAINARKTRCKNGHEFDKVYSGTRYCTTCENAKSKRLRKKWAETPLLPGI